MKPQVSVVIPTCGRPALLEEAISSVLDQTFQDFEVIVADDGTERVTRAVVDGIRARDPRVRYIVQETQRSPGATRNLGVRAARAPLIAFLDDDDLWLPVKLERQVALFEDDPGLLLAFSRMERFGARTGLWPVAEVPERPTLELLLRGNFVPTSSAVVRAEGLADSGGFDEKLSFGEDYELWLRLARQGPLRALPDVLVRYREHDTNVSRNVNLELQCLTTIYERAARDWGVPRAWVRPALRGLHRRRAGHARGFEAIKHRVAAWLT